MCLQHIAEDRPYRQKSVIRSCTCTLMHFVNIHGKIQVLLGSVLQKRSSDRTALRAPTQRSLIAINAPCLGRMRKDGSPERKTTEAVSGPAEDFDVWTGSKTPRYRWMDSRHRCFSRPSPPSFRSGMKLHDLDGWTAANDGQQVHRHIFACHRNASKSCVSAGPVWVPGAQKIWLIG